MGTAAEFSRQNGNPATGLPGCILGEFGHVQSREFRSLRCSEMHGHDTALALTNWGGLTNMLPAQVYPGVLKGIGICKAAATKVNFDLGGFTNLAFKSAESPISPESVRMALEQACKEMIEGTLHNEIVVDVLQGGAGTSLHMNANEVLARRANELLSQALGNDSGMEASGQPIHPNDTVNDGQSTNDVIPTAARIGVLLEQPELMKAMQAFEDILRAKASLEEFQNTPLVGRTHLQDAVPTTMAQVFTSYAETLAAARAHVAKTSELLLECTLGATAVGTGITSRPGYRERVTSEVNRVLLQNGAEFQLRDPRDYGKTTSSLFEFSAYSKSLAAYAIELGKIANDLRLYASGPRAGLGELSLPTRQPGSSIMPGKVNPVMLEMLNQVATIVQGNDLIVSLNSGAGQFQLNVMGPPVLWKLSESISLLRNSLNRAVDLCIKDIELNVEAATRHAQHSLVAVTALKPEIGYGRAAAIAKEALRTGASLSEVLGNAAFLSKIGVRPDLVDPNAVGSDALLGLALPPAPPVELLD